MNIDPDMVRHKPKLQIERFDYGSALAGLLATWRVPVGELLGPADRICIFHPDKVCDAVPVG